MQIFICSWQYCYHEKVAYRQKLYHFIPGRPLTAALRSCEVILGVYMHVLICIYTVIHSRNSTFGLWVVPERQSKRAVQITIYSSCQYPIILRAVCWAILHVCFSFFLHSFFSMTFPCAVLTMHSASPFFSCKCYKLYSLTFPFVCVQQLNTLIHKDNNLQWWALSGIPTV